MPEMTNRVLMTTLKYAIPVKFEISVDERVDLINHTDGILRNQVNFYMQFNALERRITKRQCVKLSY